ncbi:MAG: hypothetical protein OEZ37_13975, partial [Gemmatimonadota bacterium]|nr:hypothetical protein [Gemmatimonadota bacterium]
MRPTALAFALGFAALGTSSSAPLEVFRVSPATPADPTAPVVVTFDRPVAGDLEVAVDPEGLVTISPATVGRTYWRDPVSLVFEPETPWRYGVEYGVTVHAGLEAMDGTRLGRDHVHRFRVRQARVLEGYPVGTRGNARHQPQRPVFEVVVEASVAPEELARLASVRLSAACGGGEVALVGKGSRRVSGNDPWQIRS